MVGSVGRERNGCVITNQYCVVIEEIASLPHTNSRVFRNEDAPVLVAYRGYGKVVNKSLEVI